MTAFNADFEKVTKRFFLMMAVIIIAGFTGVWALGLLALPIFLTALMGLKLDDSTPTTTTKNIKLVPQTKKNAA